VKLCGPIVTHGPYPSTSSDKQLIIKHYINSSLYFFTLMFAATSIEKNAKSAVGISSTPYVLKQLYVTERQGITLKR